MPTLKPVTIAQIDADSMELVLGADSFTMSTFLLQDLMRGSELNINYVLFALAMHLVAQGVDPEDYAAIQQAVNSAEGFAY